MNNTSKNPACKASSGTVITGKWHKQSYRILKPLGFGANGYVYLASSTSGLVALKLSDNSMSITSEVNVLRHFSKVQEVSLGPSLLDVDDWYRSDIGKTVPFYVMEYVKGEDFLHFVQNRGTAWTGILCSQLLLDLDRLHKAGWIFGDLKPENLLVTGPPPKIRWLDVGGVTVQGRAIKEFTEFFDRGYWGMGSRVAEPTYDLFAVAMIMINASYPKRFSKNSNGGEQQLKQVVTNNPALNKYQVVLLNALGGKYKSALVMREDLVMSMSKSTVSSPSNKKVQVKNHPKQSNNNSSRKQNRTQRKKEKKGVGETVLILLFLLGAYVLYIYGQLI